MLGAPPGDHAPAISSPVTVSYGLAFLRRSSWLSQVVQPPFRCHAHVVTVECDLAYRQLSEEAVEHYCREVEGDPDEPEQAVVFCGPDAEG